MKKSQIILFTALIVISGILYTIVLSNKKDETKEKKGVETQKYISVKNIFNQKRSLTLSSYGQILPFTELDIAFEIQGRLQKGDMTLKPGTSFKKNDLLYKVSSEEMFYSLNARKAQLTNLVIAILPDISIDFPSEYEKWNLFLEGIKPSEFLPSLPSFSNKKESLFINSKGIYGEYWSIKGLEEKISKYIYLAPFTGVVSEVYIEPGSIINPGSRIARIFNRENMEVKLPIPIDVFEKFKKSGKVLFENAKGETVAEGKLLRSQGKINTNTQSIDAYYSITPYPNRTLLSGQYVTATIDNLISESVAVIPANAAKENKVYILKNHKLELQEIKVIGQKQDSLFVEGLKDNDTLVIEYIVPSKEIKKYIGITQQ
jgi:hypothetical protein